jgi:hypothetical protein
VECVPLLEEEQAAQSVTADPADHLRASLAIKQAGREVVGWYHSHPHFENFPSNTDLQQHDIHKHGDETENPFVGLIISSWSSASCESEYRWFNCIRESKGVFTPMQFQTQSLLSVALHCPSLAAAMQKLIVRYSAEKYSAFRIDMGGEWRFSLNRWQKIARSLTAHMQVIALDAEAETEAETEAGAGQQAAQQATNALIQRLRNVFLEQGHAWWLTNPPPFSTQRTTESAVIGIAEAEAEAVTENVRKTQAVDDEEKEKEKEKEKEGQRKEEGQ